MSTEITHEEKAAIYNFTEFANALLAPPKLLDIKCRICTRNIGQTTNVLHTLDLCTLCKEHWKAEMRREQADLKEKLDREMIRKYNAGVVDMIESLMMFDPIKSRFAK